MKQISIKKKLIAKYVMSRGAIFLQTSTCTCTTKYIIMMRKLSAPVPHGETMKANNADKNYTVSSVCFSYYTHVSTVSTTVLGFLHFYFYYDQ